MPNCLPTNNPKIMPRLTLEQVLFILNWAKDIPELIKIKIERLEIKKFCKTIGKKIYYQYYCSI